MSSAQMGRKADSVPRGHHQYKGLAADLAPGKVAVFDLSAIENVKHKAYAHIAFFRLLITAVFDTVDATLPATVGGFTLLDFVGNLKLKVAGHEHFSGMAGGMLMSALANGRFPNLTTRILDRLPAQLTKGGGNLADQERTIEIFIPMMNPMAPVRGRFDRCIPVGVFDRGAKGTSEFSCQVQRTLPERAPGVTCTGVNAAELEVGLVYLDKVNEPTQWEIATTRDSKKVKTLESRGAWESLVIFNQRDDSYTGSHEDYLIKQVTLGSQPLLDQPHTGLEMMEAEAAWHFDDQDVFSSEAYVTGVPYVPIFIAAEGETRISKMASGPVRIDITSRPVEFDDDQLVYLDTGLRTPEYSRVFREELGAPVEGGGLVVEIGAAGGGGGPIEPFLPASLYWPGCPAALVAEKASRKLAQGAA